MQSGETTSRAAKPHATGRSAARPEPRRALTTREAAAFLGVSEWPYVGKRGAKSYRIGFRDHDGIERTRAFPSARSANEWTDAYISAERRGKESLRRFLLDLDAKEANGSQTGQTIGEVIELYFAFNAPDTEDGLADSTFRTYRHVATRHLLGLRGMTAGRPSPVAHHAVEFASQTAVAFNEPAAPRALREAMKHTKVGPSARAHRWRVLSAVLSWAASSPLVPDIETNGCLLANERVSNRRKSMRANGGTTSMRRRGTAVSGWALSPASTELLRAQMLSETRDGSPTLVAQRDAIVVSLQFGLALRNQEVFGLRWSSFVDQHRARIEEVLGWNTLDSLGKTEKATGRIARVPLLLEEDLQVWRPLLRRHGFSTRGVDFVIPGEHCWRRARRQRGHHGRMPHDHQPSLPVAQPLLQARCETRCAATLRAGRSCERDAVQPTPRRHLSQVARGKRAVGGRSVRHEPGNALAPLQLRDR
jgi:hypothetical protein